MDEISFEDQSAVLRICKDHGIGTSDPMVLFLIEWMKVKKAINTQKVDEGALLMSLKSQISQIGETLEIQKGVAGVLHSQVGNHNWIKCMSFLIGLGVLIFGITLGYWTSNYISESGRLAKKISSTGTVVSVSDRGNNNELVINSSNIVSASRDNNRVVITLRGNR